MEGNCIMIELRKAEIGAAASPGASVPRVNVTGPTYNDANFLEETRLLKGSGRHQSSYHAFTFAKYAHRYPAESQYRRFNMKMIPSRLLAALVLVSLWQEWVLRSAGVSR
jgi:hypothetical protein